MKAIGRLLNVVDVEATCWKGNPPDGQRNEIIEIGLCVVDMDLRRRVSRHQIMVRPLTSTVSPFCTELTGHTQSDVDKGVSFERACQILITEHQTRSRPWASWGDYDRNQFTRQCQAANIESPFGAVHINAKRVFGAAQRKTRGPGMAGALSDAGIRLEGRHHNGADDAWNIAALTLDLMERDAWPSTG